jgi:hypothetical protein
VINGAPVKIWGLDCPPCEADIFGEGKPLKLVYIKDKTGAVLRQERVADTDPCWSRTPDTIPLSPDEERTHALQLERGEQQLRALESIATLDSRGINFRDRPDVLFYLREQELPEDVLQGIIVCANGHGNVAGLKFCGECGISMAARGAIAAPAPAPAPAASDERPIDLTVLHPQSLKKLARERGLSDKGSKDDLIRRLKAA